MAFPRTRIVVAVLVAAAGCAAASAAAGLRVGIAEDATKYADDGGSNFFKSFNDLGMTANRITVLWDPTDGNDGLTIAEEGFLDRSLPVAAIHGIDVVLSVYPAQARAFAVDTQNRIVLFAQFLQKLAVEYPQVKMFIVGNEPNQPRFMQPQFVRDRKGNYRPVAAATFARVMAASYDALKAVDPEITVVGIGLSPRGNDNPRARSNISRSPVRFIADLAAAYRKSRRTRPLMDALGFHPYPNSNADPFVRGYSWPNAGLPNLDRIKQAIWDGFHGTAQPVFGEGAREAPGALRLVLDEYGRQAQIISSVRRMYTGRENIRPVNEATQARMYAQTLRLAACDPTVSDLFFFHLIDETDLDRFQSGLLRADGTPRPSYDAVKQELAETGGRCTGKVRSWRHTRSVLDAEVTFGASTVEVRAAEDVVARVGVFPAATSRRAIVTALSRGTATRNPAAHVRAYRVRTLPIRLDRLARGSYVAAVVVRAAVNPSRMVLTTKKVLVR